jgi:hypothetical protein
MTALSIVFYIAAFAIVAAISSGVIDALLPGGRWNPYRATNVTKGHTAVRVVAYLVAIALALVMSALGSRAG